MHNGRPEGRPLLETELRKQKNYFRFLLFFVAFFFATRFLAFFFFAIFSP
jgi:hypothetical protein